MAKVDISNVAPEATVSVPATEKAALAVVVPLLIVRLPNEVIVDEGKVFVAFSSTVPVLGVQVFAFPATVITPFTFRVLPAVIVILLACVAMAPKARLPHSSVEPFTKVMVPSLFVAEELPTVTAPITFKTGLPVAANVSIAVLFPLLLICKEAHVAVV
jgi:hypothetical protein